MEILLPPSAKLGFLDELAPYSTKKLRCSARGVLVGSKPNVFSGLKQALAFRLAAYKRVGVKAQSRPNKQLVVFNRENAGRRFENIAEMEVLFKRYNIPYVILGKHGTFADQVRTMASAGVLMVAHGAAALNTIFQQQRSVLMEVFPYKRRRFGFMAAAQAAGQFYMPLFPHVKPWTGKSVMNETKFMDACDHISGIETNRVSVCDAAQKVVTIRIDMDELERTLINAFDVIGYPITPSY